MRYSPDFFRRNLPHIDKPGASYFITFRLAGSIPKVKLDKLKSRYRNDLIDLDQIENVHQRNLSKFNRRKVFLLQYDELLDKIKSGPMFLKIPRVRDIIAEQIHRFHGKLYDLTTFSIMSNHVHILFDSYLEPKDILIRKDPFLGCVTVSKIMKRIKGATARYCNMELKRSGTFWSDESFDIYIRNEKMYWNVHRYILNNPVKASIVKDWKDFEGNYSRYPAI